MSKSILSKVAAVACSVASVIALGVCASAEKLEVNGTNYDLDTSKVNLVATKNTVDINDLKDAEYKVKYDVEVANNTGFGPCGVRLVYPKEANLEVVPQGTKKKPGIVGAVGQSLMAYLTDNPEEYNVALGCAGMENTEENGVFFTVEFKLPESAKVGDKIPLKIEVDKFLDENNKQVPYNLVDGYIEIIGTPETTTAPPIVTTVTAPITTPAPVPTTTPAPVPTTTPAPAPTTTTSAPAPASSTTAAVSTTSGKGGTVANNNTTAATGGNKNTTKAGATQTGDTGAGVAVAALLLAAGTAVAAAKKKED
jgi:outer membrane biosynthesis protein TonB